MSPRPITSTDRLIHLIGSPFVDRAQPEFTDEELLGLYDDAFPDRVASLYLTLYRREGWSSDLEDRYQHLEDRRNMTRSVIAEVARVMNEFDPASYVIFKSIKPYPATPNDTDVLFLGDRNEYRAAYQFLLDKGYKFHEWAPQQKTLYDPRGEDSIGEGKKGGTYYIDFYEEISTDYYAYTNKHKLKPHIYAEMIDGVPVQLLRPEPELAIVLFHNVFPERTFQLEHFYLPLYYMASSRFDLEFFLRFVRSERLAAAVRANLTLVEYLHEKHFGFSPPPIQTVLQALGPDRRELQAFQAGGDRTPYLFRPMTFWGTFARKSRDPYAARSLVVQAVKMLNPVFFMDVVGAIRLRMSQKGAYHLE